MLNWFAKVNILNATNTCLLLIVVELQVKKFMKPEKDFDMHRIQFVPLHTHIMGWNYFVNQTHPKE